MSEPVHRPAARLLRGGVTLALLLAAAGAHAWGVSGKHLTEEGRLTCDLESAPQEFGLRLIARDRALQIEGSETKIPYEEVSETVLRFRLTPPGGPALSCELEMPAGALTCTDRAGATQIGFCVPAF